MVDSPAVVNDWVDWPGPWKEASLGHGPGFWTQSLKIFVVQVNSDQKASTMEEVLNCHINKMTQASLHQSAHVIGYCDTGTTSAQMK